jgi:hypothetical protein
MSGQEKVNKIAEEAGEYLLDLADFSWEEYMSSSSMHQYFELESNNNADVFVNPKDTARKYKTNSWFDEKEFKIGFDEAKIFQDWSVEYKSSEVIISDMPEYRKKIEQEAIQFIDLSKKEILEELLCFDKNKKSSELERDVSDDIFNRMWCLGNFESSKKEMPEMDRE